MGVRREKVEEVEIVTVAHRAIVHPTVEGGEPLVEAGWFVRERLPVDLQQIGVLQAGSMVLEGVRGVVYNVREGDLGHANVSQRVWHGGWHPA